MKPNESEILHDRLLCCCDCNGADIGLMDNDDVTWESGQQTVFALNSTRRSSRRDAGCTLRAEPARSSLCADLLHAAAQVHLPRHCTR